MPNGGAVDCGALFEAFVRMDDLKEFDLAALLRDVLAALHLLLLVARVRKVVGLGHVVSVAVLLVALQHPKARFLVADQQQDSKTAPKAFGCRPADPRFI